MTTASYNFYGDMMNLMVKSLTAITFCLTTATAFAVPEPEHLITHNNTNEESNAFIAGTIPSPYPTAAHKTRKIYWSMVKIACNKHTTNGKCSALIKMATNTTKPIELGTVTMDIKTGDITPKRISNQGYTVVVNGPGETTITKD